MPRILLAALLLLAMTSLAGEVDESARELEKLREQIRATRSELDDLSGREADASAALAQSEREARLLRQLLPGLDGRERMLAARRDSLQTHLEVNLSAYALRRQALSSRLRALAMGGSQRDLEVILTSQSFAALVTRLRFGTMIARLDANLMRETRRQGLQIAAAQTELQVALTGIWEAREEASRERQRLDLIEASQRGLVRDLQKDKKQTASLLESLTAREQRLLDVLSRLEERRKTSPPPTPDGTAGASADGRLAGRRGSLGWPVAGEVVQGFGKQVHPQFKTVTLSNGVSISASPASPVYAVAAGTVEFAENLPGFGLCVILDHGGGQYTLYANLAHVFVSAGRDVSQGQVLAELGQGKSGERPQLYFEIRNGRDPQDPLLWLSPTH
jgi:septal ring factor EnvC (AmiA/AmiB activator)